MNSDSPTPAPTSPSRDSPQRVLLTGGSGYLGRHLTARLQSQFRLRVLDVATVPEAASDTEVILGSVTDSALVEKAVDGVDALVIAHMAPNKDEAYADVDLPFSINVQGTAALLHAAARQGIRRVVLISSTTVVDKARISGITLTADLPHQATNIYGLTKCLQEVTARFYHEKHGMEIALLRPAYVILEDPLTDKYGRTPPSVNWQFIDPRDIAEATALAITAPQIGFDIIYTLGGPGHEARADMETGRRLLGWQPKHLFGRYPVDA